MLPVSQRRGGGRGEPFLLVHIDYKNMEVFGTMVIGIAHWKNTEHLASDQKVQGSNPPQNVILDESVLYINIKINYIITSLICHTLTG